MITEFKDQYSFLSNDFPVEVKYGPYYFPSVTHAEAAARIDPNHNNATAMIIALSKAPNPKRLGRLVQARAEFVKEKESILLSLLRQKFMNENLKGLLIGTGDMELINGNYVHDNEWGDCLCDACKDKEGLNKEGKMLMMLREELKVSTS